MSRSNPTVNAPNPAARWFEWNGEHGTVRHYDKAAKKNLDVPLPFTFLLLDELASVRGWDDASESGIYSNEVRDTTKDVLVVKTFKGVTIAEGHYKAIKDLVKSRGASFVANCYVAVKLDAGLSICSLRFKGSALGAWMEFRKAHRAALYDQAIQITGYTEGKKGRITFRMPIFELEDVPQEIGRKALALDVSLQAFMDGYLKRKTRDQADDPDERGEYHQGESAEDGTHSVPLTDDDIPFAWLLPLLLAGSMAAHSLLV